MDITRDPSSPIECFRYPNLHIVDNAGIFSTRLGGLLTYPIDGIEYNVLSNNVKLIIYTSVSESGNWKTTNLSTNEIAVFIFKDANKINFRIKLADNLFLLSRFYPDKLKMFGCEIILEVKDFIPKKLSIEFVLRLFDTVNEPLFNVITKEQSKNIQKPIKITKKGDLKPVVQNPIPDKLNITIGLFFDGTGNNKFNTKKVHDVFASLAETQKKIFSEVIDDYRLGKIPFISEKSLEFKEYMFKHKSSYLNKYSNISILYDLYNETKDGEEKKENEIIKKIYIEGIGTKRDKADSKTDSGTGRGDYGVLFRCMESIESIVLMLSNIQEAKLENEKKLEFGEILFDLFGFSRGAAAARLFYRILFTDSPNQTEEIKLTGKYDKYMSLKNLMKDANFQIRFYGLFDTVLSTINANAVYPTEQDISLIHCKKTPCYHITAQNELRENFPLTHVDSDNWVHLELLGCHSDIGGSYTTDKFAATFAYKESEKNEPSYDLKKMYNLYKSLYAVDTSKKYLRYFTNQFSINYKQMRIITEFEPNNQNYKEQGGKYISRTKFGYIAQENRFIEDDIYKVSLNAMLSFALQHNLPFSVSKKEINSKLSPKDKYTLEKYNDKVQILINKITNSNNGSEDFEESDYFDLYNKFIHISESYGYQIFSNVFKSKIHEVNPLYSDRPAKDRMRVVYLNGK